MRSLLFAVFLMLLCQPVVAAAPHRDRVYHVVQQVRVAAAVMVEQTWSWLQYWSRFSDHAWALWVEGAWGYSYEEWREYFSQFSAADWYWWQAEYLFPKILKMIRRRRSSRL